MGCHVRSSDVPQPFPYPPMGDNVYIIIHICILAVTFPESPLELSSSPLPGWGPGLAYLLWGCQMVASPPVLTNTFPSAHPQKLDQLTPSFLLGAKFRASSSSLYLSPLISALNPFLGWGLAMLSSAFLPQICLAYSCGYRELIYREGPVAAATPATAGLGPPHIEGILPWWRPSWLLIFHFPHCGKAVG